MKFDDLDARQLSVVDAVLNSDDKLLVLGGPGTGKTTTALWSARCYLEQSKEIPVPRVLFLTFSRSAIGQIMSRSPGVLDGVEERVEVLTFHGLCYRLLRAFGRYVGLGPSRPNVESEARAKLRGRDKTRLSYDDLIQYTLRLLEDSARIRALLAARWGLVICDETQDTSLEQWRLLQLTATRKVMLLGDPNQMIYAFIAGVSADNFKRIRDWVDHEIELLPRSHRDPSGAISALAESVRVRDFGHQAVLSALASGRLTIHFDIDESNLGECLAAEIKRARESASRDVGIFAHSNAAVFEVGEVLNALGIDHALIGIPEAHADALNAMAVECQFAVGLATEADLREALAVFLTAAVRGQQAPPLAIQIDTGQNLAADIEHALQELKQALLDLNTGSIGDLAIGAGSAWDALRIGPGRRAWYRATRHFARLIAPLRDLPVDEALVRRLTDIVERARTDALIARDYSESGRVKLMNYHQTKGREADTVIHVFRSNDYFGPEREPFIENSRLLHVAVSRARKRVVVILPPVPHGLVRPFTGLRGLAEEPSETSG